jgi:polyisoprenoid-binding protein YceI
MRAWAILASAGVAIAAFAAPPAWAAPAWVVDKARSRLGFDSAFGGVTFSGVFQQWDAAIAFDPKDLATSRAAVSINLASVRTGQKERDEGLPGPDWFNTAKFPKATFTAETIRPVDANRYVALGVLALKGVSKPVTLPFTVSIKGDTAVMTGQVAIDRSAWGVGAGPFAAEDVAPHAVVVSVSITAAKAR